MSEAGEGQLAEAWRTLDAYQELAQGKPLARLAAAYNEACSLVEKQTRGRRRAERARLQAALSELEGQLTELASAIAKESAAKATATGKLELERARAAAAKLQELGWRRSDATRKRGELVAELARIPASGSFNGTKTQAALLWADPSADVPHAGLYRLLGYEWLDMPDEAAVSVRWSADTGDVIDWGPRQRATHPK